MRLVEKYSKKDIEEFLYSMRSIAAKNVIPRDSFIETVEYLLREDLSKVLVWIVGPGDSHILNPKEVPNINNAVCEYGYLYVITLLWSLNVELVTLEEAKSLYTTEVDSVNYFNEKYSDIWDGFIRGMENYENN